MLGTSADRVDVPASYLDDFLPDFFLATVTPLRSARDLIDFLDPELVDGRGSTRAALTASRSST
jgi:hypothetical protein